MKQGGVRGRRGGIWNFLDGNSEGGEFSSSDLWVTLKTGSGTGIWGIFSGKKASWLGFRRNQRVSRHGVNGGTYLLIDSEWTRRGMKQRCCGTG